MEISAEIPAKTPMVPPTQPTTKDGLIKLLYEEQSITRDCASARLNENRFLVQLFCEKQKKIILYLIVKMIQEMDYYSATFWKQLFCLRFWRPSFDGEAYPCLPTRYEW